MQQSHPLLRAGVGISEPLTLRRSSRPRSTARPVVVLQGARFDASSPVVKAHPEKFKPEKPTRTKGP